MPTKTTTTSMHSSIQARISIQINDDADNALRNLNSQNEFKAIN